MVAAPKCLGQAWFWAARQEGGPAEIPAAVGVWRLQPTRLRVSLSALQLHCRVLTIASGTDAVQNGLMPAPSPQERSLSERLQSAREQVLAVAHRHGARNLRIYGSVHRAPWPVVRIDPAATSTFWWIWSGAVLCWR